MIKNTKQAYGVVSRFFHWLLFLLISGAVAGGLYAHELPKGDQKLEMIALHKSFGVIILMCVLLRLLWRLLNPTPEHLGSNTLQNKVASAMYGLLYVLMLAQPISGFMMSQLAGYKITLFGLFTLPTLLEKNKEIGDLLHGLHEIIWIVLVLAVLGHILAAIKHHFIDKDNVLMRMLKGV